jgi:hypothetical protein
MTENNWRREGEMARENKQPRNARWRIEFHGNKGALEMIKLTGCGGKWIKIRPKEKTYGCFSSVGRIHRLNAFRFVDSRGMPLFYRVYSTGLNARQLAQFEARV